MKDRQQPGVASSPGHTNCKLKSLCAWEPQYIIPLEMRVSGNGSQMK